VAEQTKLEAKLETLRQNETISEEAMREMIQEVIKLSELKKRCACVRFCYHTRKRADYQSNLFRTLYFSRYVAI